MHNPPHPGEVLHEMYISPLGFPLTPLRLKIGKERLNIPWQQCLIVFKAIAIGYIQRDKSDNQQGHIH